MTDNIFPQIKKFLLTEYKKSEVKTFDYIVRKLKKEQPKRYGKYSDRTIADWFTKLRKEFPDKFKDHTRAKGKKEVKTIPLDKLKEKIKKELKTPRTIVELANKFNKAPKEITAIIEELKSEKYNLHIADDTYEISREIKQGGQLRIDLSKFNNKTYKLGLVSDNHLNSKYERLDILNALYDKFEQEGITEVYNAGNWIDGVCNFNKHDVINTGMTAQVDYFIKNYPQRKGITTYFIAGDDHEGWYVQREGINIGEYAQMKAEQAGRFDLKYIGYIEADIELVNKKGKAILKVQHPGGGSAYALSYSPQKMIESLQGGEKPQILAMGHYHKSEYIYYRDVHCIQTGCTQDQTPFLRKKKIQVALGGWIIEFQQSQDGAINSFKGEWLSFFNKKYYRRNDYYLRA